MRYGTAVIDGHRFPIYELHLRGGKIEAVFGIPGPFPPFRGPITIIGEDGRGCWQGKTYEVPDGVPENCIWECHYGMTMAQVLTGGETTTLTPG